MTKKNDLEEQDSLTFKSLQQDVLPCIARIRELYIDMYTNTARAKKSMWRAMATGKWSNEYTALLTQIFRSFEAEAAQEHIRCESAEKAIVESRAALDIAVHCLTGDHEKVNLIGTGRDDGKLQTESEETGGDDKPVALSQKIDMLQKEIKELKECLLKKMETPEHAAPPLSSAMPHASEAVPVSQIQTMPEPQVLDSTMATFMNAVGGLRLSIAKLAMDVETLNTNVATLTADSQSIRSDVKLARMEVSSLKTDVCSTNYAQRMAYPGSDAYHPGGFSVHPQFGLGGEQAYFLRALSEIKGAMEGMSAGVREDMRQIKQQLEEKLRPGSEASSHLDGSSSWMAVSDVDEAEAQSGLGETDEH